MTHFCVVKSFVSASPLLGEHTGQTFPTPIPEGELPVPGLAPLAVVEEITQNMKRE